MTTYNTGKVKISLPYQAAMPTIQGDEIRLQTALLHKRTARPANLVMRALARFWSWA
jgi:hypothetical protein